MPKALNLSEVSRKLSTVRLLSQRGASAVREPLALSEPHKRVEPRPIVNVTVAVLEGRLIDVAPQVAGRHRMVDD